MVEGSVRRAGLWMRNAVSLDPASTDASIEDCSETTSFNTVCLVSQRGLGEQAVNSNFGRVGDVSCQSRLE